jgi:hypothetical protein
MNGFLQSALETMEAARRAERLSIFVSIAPSSRANSLRAATRQRPVTRAGVLNDRATRAVNE